jgi:hypothetical protein
MNNKKRPTDTRTPKNAMDRSELENQKSAEMRVHSRDVLAWTRRSNAGDQSDSHRSVDDKVVFHPNETYGIKEEILEDPPKPLKPILLPATQILNLTRRIGDDELLKRPELGANNSAVVPNMVPPTSQKGGDGIAMVQQQPPILEKNRRQERERRELKANDEEEDASSDEEMKPRAVAVPGLFPGRTSPSVFSESAFSESVFSESVFSDSVFS